MRVIVCDLETTTRTLDNGKRDPSPFARGNRIVSAHWRVVEDGVVGPPKRAILYHDEAPRPDPVDALFADLRAADLFVAHNAKFDALWLQEIEAPLPPRVYCTMIGEYVLARGQRVELSLEDVAERRNVTRKKGELVKEMFDKGVGFEKMPLDVVIEYADADVLSCAEVYLQQLEQYDEPVNAGLKPTRDLMNENLLFLCEIERNGIKIDLAALDDVEREFQTERDRLDALMRQIVRDVMGDTPINLNSGRDISWVVYSRAVNDRDKHIQTFNIGVDARGRKKYPPRMKPGAFIKAIRANTRVVNRTQAHHCVSCDGRGKIQKFRKDGEPYKLQHFCKVCDGRGYVLLDTGRVAGFKLVPEGPEDATVNGFAVDKKTINRLIYQATQKGNDQAVEFLEALRRVNALNVYLDSFVSGIRRWTREDGLLHANFNQCVTATGRLSSSDPNFQNQPRGGTFPVRRAVKSRWPGGLIVEADYSGLEFRVAADLSRDEQMIADILAGKDVHKQTASIVNQIPVEQVTKAQRQVAKSYCVPLDSEILTRDGWKTYEQLSVGEDVLTYNPKSDRNEWQPLLDVAYFDDAEVVEIGHTHWRVRTTPEHRWFGLKRKYINNARVVVRQEFTTEQWNSEYALLASAYTEGGNGRATPREAAILGWLWSDGWYRSSEYVGASSQAGGVRVGISGTIIQKKRQHVKCLDSLLHNMYTQRLQDENGCIRWVLKAEALRDVFLEAGVDPVKPDYIKFVLELSTDARAAFLDAVIAAEGHYRDYGQVRVSQNAGSFSDAIRLALCLEGYDTRISTRLSRTGKYHDVYTARKNRTITGQRVRKKPVGRMPVWCPRTQNGFWIMRQGKVVTITGNTFSPLYGGQGASEPEHVRRYFKEFFQIYQGMGRQHELWKDSAVSTGVVRIPSGREFAFPHAKRGWRGNVSGSTQIVNFPVQGFATADIVPLACIRALREFRARGLKSLLVLTVHDSIVVDCYPGELDAVVAALSEAMLGVPGEIKARYDYELVVPLAVEIEAGANWMDKEGIELLAA